LENLNKKAMKKPLGPFLDRYIKFDPDWHGIGIKGNNIVKDIKNFLKKKK
jgi:hypothetical protein